MRCRAHAGRRRSAACRRGHDGAACHLHRRSGPGRQEAGTRPRQGARPAATGRASRRQAAAQGSRGPGQRQE